MNQELTTVLSGGYAIMDSIDEKKLHENTSHIPINQLHIIPVEGVRHLHIIGYDKYEQVMNPEIRFELEPGCYYDDTKSWVLLLCASERVILDMIAQCTTDLEVLTVRFTQFKRLDVSHLSGLKELDLADNRYLDHVKGLSWLYGLRKLNLSDGSMGPVLDMNVYPELEHVIISRSKIETVVLDRPLKKMRFFRANGTAIRDAAFLVWFPGLEHLSMSYTPVKELPALEQFPELNYLCMFHSQLQSLPQIRNLLHLEEIRLGHTQITSLDDIVFPAQIRRIWLDHTLIRRLPDSLGRLRGLLKLDLEGLTLEEIPNWLADLGLPISNKFSSGIFLGNTKVLNVDMSIFDRSQEMILEWFEERKKKAGSDLNEVKVVFLGDGEAGKTHTITRLLKGGEILTPEETPGDATPGIVITDQFYDLDDRRIQVHFWDFGGQEILHSMHRMFLTERTLYVVLLNARDNTQNDRARYWLHNIKSFAGDVPTLLVLNKTDQNAHATVNISDLREICPDLPEAVRLSALKDSPAEFNRKLTGAMLDAIRNIDTIDTFFPDSWKQVKDAIQTMETPYIRGDAYKRLCDDNRVDSKNQRDVLDLFKTLGVSFYYPGVKLEDYVVLRPDWITNAIYIILFNKRDEVKNGLISHETIYRLLNPRPGDAVKRVLPDATYSNDEVTYVLDVVRRFRLSYLVEDGMEFIPMLCDSNSLPVAAEYAADPNALEFRMKFDYLPNNVIHRLMVELRQHLDQDHVWLTGALFREKSKGFSAVVKTEGNLLRIFVRAEKPRYTADMYLDTIRDALKRINDDMGLKVAKNQVVYKADDIVECFDYDDLILSQELGDTTVTSRVRRKKVPIADILSQTDHRVDKARETLIGDVLSACRSLQANQFYWKAGEDDRNTFIRDILRAKGYIVSDQTRSGISAGGKQAGELDLDIRQEADMPWTILEALNLSGKGDSQIAYWDGHLKKLLDNYNANGLRFLLHVSYVECPKDKFSTICAAYSDHLRFHSPAQYTGALQTTPEGYGENHFIRAYQCVYDCNGDPTRGYHFFVRMGE